MAAMNDPSNSLIEELLKASDAAIRDSNIKISLSVAKPLKVRDLIEKIRGKNIKRTMRRNNGTLPIWTPEYENKENVQVNLSDEEQSQSKDDHNEDAWNESDSPTDNILEYEKETHSSDSGELLVNSTLSNEDFEDEYHSSETSDSDTSNSNSLEQSIPTEKYPRRTILDYDDLGFDNQNKANTTSDAIHEDELDFIPENNQKSSLKKEVSTKNSSSYLKMLAADFEKKSRRSVFIDEEAEEEGVDFQNDVEELSHEAQLASSFINEIRDLIDDEVDEKESNSIHQSLFAKQVVEESLEESAMIAEIFEEKKGARLSNLSIKKKYGKKAASMLSFEAKSIKDSSPRNILNSIAADDESEQNLENEETIDFLIWREQNKSINSNIKALEREASPCKTKFSSNSTSILPPISVKKRSSEAIISRLNSLNSTAFNGSNLAFTASKYTNR